MSVSDGLLLPASALPASLLETVPPAVWRDAASPARRWVDTTQLGDEAARSLQGAVAHLPVRGTLIHGDAGEALTWWAAQEDGRALHMVYADPPYNTGSADQPYPDALPRDAWLARFPALLRRCYDLLAPSGAMFCSIDDTLLFHLKLAMDDALGEDAFLASMPWIKRYSPAPDVRGIAYVHETVLAWRRSAAFRPGRLPPTAEKLRRYRNPDGDPRGPWKAMDYTCRYTREERPNLWFAVHRPDGQEVWPSPTRVWSCSAEQHAENERSGRVWWGRSGRNRMPSLKKYLSEVPEGMPAASVLHHEQVGHTDGAARELRAVVAGVKYTPKPTGLIRHLRAIAATPHGGAVLDPFAGSGSTGAACLAEERATGHPAPFVLIEHGAAFDAILLPRIARLTLSGSWIDGEPTVVDPLPVVHRIVRLGGHQRGTGGGRATLP